MGHISYGEKHIIISEPTFLKAYLTDKEKNMFTYVHAAQVGDRETTGTSGFPFIYRSHSVYFERNRSLNSDTASMLNFTVCVRCEYMLISMVYRYFCRLTTLFRTIHSHLPYSGITMTLMWFISGNMTRCWVSVQFPFSYFQRFCIHGILPTK